MIRQRLAFIFISHHPVPKGRLIYNGIHDGEDNVPPPTRLCVLTAFEFLDTSDPDDINILIIAIKGHFLGPKTIGGLPCYAAMKDMT